MHVLRVQQDTHVQIRPNNHSDALQAQSLPLERKLPVTLAQPVFTAPILRLCPRYAHGILHTATTQLLVRLRARYVLLAINVTTQP